MPLDKMRFGAALRGLRTQRGLTQANLAKRSGMQSNAIAMIERGERGVTGDSITDLAKGLDLTPALLFLMGTVGNAGDPDSIALVSNMRKVVEAVVSAEEKLKKLTKAKRPRAASRKKPVRSDAAKPKKSLRKKTVKMA